jgi:hypothetical protein
VAVVIGVGGGDPGLLDGAAPDGGALPDAGHPRDGGLDAPAPIDAGVDAPDAPLDAPDAPDVRELSRTEREDLAKDELDFARAAIARGEREDAARHLEAARELDPESSDLEEVQALLDAMP